MVVVGDFFSGKRTMVELMSGIEKVLPDLISFFENVPEDMMWNDYYNHANEPVHFVPFLFNRLGVPWLTQKWTREICCSTRRLFPVGRLN